MIKLTTPVYNNHLTVVLEVQNNRYIVYMLDEMHNKQLNVKQYTDYNKALTGYNTRCIGL